ncbi:hypothetical protein [Streptomyces sp. NPDC055709]
MQATIVCQRDDDGRSGDPSVQRLEQLSYYPQLVDQIRELAGQGIGAAGIADRLGKDSRGYDGAKGQRPRAAPVVDTRGLVLLLNSRPRKTLGWKTLAEALNEHLLLAQDAGVATID